MIIIVAAKILNLHFRIYKSTLQIVNATMGQNISEMHKDQLIQYK